MLAQDAFHQPAEIRAHVLAQCPVDCNVVSYGLHQFACDVAQRFVAQHLNRTVVDTKRVVEGEFVFRQSKFLASCVCFTQLACKVDQFLDYLRSLMARLW